MTFTYPLSRPIRPYSTRQSSEHVRRAMLSARIHEQARQSVATLAAQRRMSVSEYVARLLNDHLRQAANRNRLDELSRLR